MAEKFVNDVVTTLSAGISNSATSLTVVSSTGLPTLVAGDRIRARLEPQAPNGAFEIVLVTAISGTTLTVVRAQEGTTGVAWSTGALVSFIITAGQMASLSSLAFDVRMFGAVGNGSTDDATAVQAAFDAASAVGGTVYFPPTSTSYLIGTSLVPTGDIVIQGAGWNSTLKAKNSLNNFIINYDTTRVPGNRIVIRDLAFDGNNTNQTAGGCVRAYNPVQGLFDNVHFAKPYDVGLHLFGQQGSGPFGHHNRVVNCLFDNGGTSAGSGQGLRIQSADENYIHACDFEANGGSGSEAYHVKDWSGINLFSSCVFVGGKEGIRLQDIFGTRVMGCIFDGVGGDNISLSGSNLSIQSCLFSGIAPGATTNTYKHLVLDNGGYCSVLGNTFDSGTQTPSVRTAISQFSSSTHNAIVGNVFRQNTTVYGSGGIYDFNGSSAAATNTILRSNNGLADAG